MKTKFLKLCIFVLINLNFFFNKLVLAESLFIENFKFFYIGEKIDLNYDYRDLYLNYDYPLTAHLNEQKIIKDWKFKRKTKVIEIDKRRLEHIYHSKWLKLNREKELIFRIRKKNKCVHDVFKSVNHQENKSIGAKRAKKIFECYTSF